MSLTYQYNLLIDGAPATPEDFKRAPKKPENHTVSFIAQQGETKAQLDLQAVFGEKIIVYGISPEDAQKEYDTLIAAREVGGISFIELTQGENCSKKAAAALEEFKTSHPKETTTFEYD